MDIKEMRRDILEYDLFEVVSNMPYGSCFVSIYNTEVDKVVIFIEDDDGSAIWAMDKKDFFTYGATVEGLERLLNGILYYNYIEGKEK